MEEKLASFLRNHKINPKGQNARSYIFDCPACGGERKLYISKKDGMSVCFKGKTEKCPRPGSHASYALSLLSGLPIDAVKREIIDFIENLVDHIRVSFDEKIGLERKEEPLPTVMLPMDVTFLDDRQAEDGIAYLERRGLPLEVQKKYGVLYSPSMRRVIFPVIMDQKLYGWQGRAIDKVRHEDRMYNIPGPWKARTLMFYENIIGKDFAIVAEGPVSAMKFHKVGNFVATMGKEVSNKQLELLRQAGVKRVYLAIDRDAVDKYNKIRYSLDNDLLGKIECFFIPIPAHRDDFGDCTFEECEAAFASASKLNGDQVFSHIEAKLSKYGNKTKI